MTVVAQRAETGVTDSPLPLARVAALPSPQLHLVSTAVKSLQWPRFDALLQASGGGWLKQLKMRIRLVRARALGPQLVADAVNPHGWQPLFFNRMDRLYPALSHFIDRRWGMRQRFQCMAYDLTAARTAFGTAACSEIALGRNVELARIDENLRVVLEANVVSYHEGLWAVSLRCAEGRRLYTASFAFVQPNTLLIGSVQGPQSDTDCRDDMRELTKRCHGLRPAPLLIAALQMCAPHFGVNTLLGIDPEHHVKGRWNLRSRRLRYDYRALWAELGAARERTGYWALPLTQQRKTEAEIPTRKRALYRRRFELLDHITTTIKMSLNKVHATP
jgi:uncharacterized protein